MALPGLRSNKFIIFVDRATTKVATIILGIDLLIVTAMVKPTKPPKRALKAPVVNVPLNKALK